MGVTADHSHVFTIGGYPGRGNSIFGVQDNTREPAFDKMPYTSLGYVNGVAEERYNLTGVDTESPDFQQSPGFKTQSGETHGGEDVALFATGPWSHLFSGVKEQNYIAHALAHASCIGDYTHETHCHISSGMKTELTHYILLISTVHHAFQSVSFL